MCKLLDKPFSQLKYEDKLLIIKNVDDTHKRLYCSLGLSRDEDCPVDGGWSPWGIWGPCQGECGQVGRRMRQRTCTNPMPVNGGSPCTGEDTESEACELKGCTLEEYEGLVMGDPLRAAQLRILRETRDKFPALSERCIVTTCRFQTVESVLKETAMDYWNALHCVKHNVGCPVRGGWTNWTPWSPCSAKCGLGSRYQERSCTKPVPSTPQLKCEGPRFQTHTCEGLSCAPKLDGKWSEWKPWSECSVKCGPGIKTRKRDCLITEKKREVEPESMEGVSLAALEGENIDEVKSLSKREGQTLLSGTACSGPSEEVEECMKEDCSVDGGWSAWEVWQPCSAECGIGAQSRSRSCSNPAPQGGGVLCTGTITEVRHCFKRPCTVKTHQVAVFPGDGSLLYSSSGRPARLILIFIRFLPLATSGNLIVRYQDDCSGTSCDFTKLVLEGQFLVLSAQLSGCRATVVSVNKLELSKWHVALATVTGTTVTLRVDDAPGHEFAGFNCVPILPEMDHPMRIGERYRGQIQRLAVNFNPVRLHRVKVLLNNVRNTVETGSAPYASSNVIYEVADAEEGYRQLKGKELVRAACPAHPEHWKVEIALRPKTMDGLLMFLPGEISKEYMLATLESGHVRVRVRWGNVWAEADSIDEVVPGHWLLVTVHRTDKEVSLSTNGGEPVIVTALSEETPAVCKGEMLVGDMPNNVKKQIEETEAMKSQGNGSSAALQSLQGDLGSLEVDDSQLDLSLLPAEIEPLRQFSSHSSSVSEAYEEVALPVGQQLNLTCFLGPLASGTHVPGHGKIETAIVVADGHPESTFNHLHA
ncbi:uncharacterized protein [Anabrus simplex]|uniref:uncharacterized protein n=1 Tax=Anabrus simplex TaxID=316456 RepID=UPI0035A28E8B